MSRTRLSRINSRIDARSRSLALNVRRILRRIGEQELKDYFGNDFVIAKRGLSEIEEELIALIQKYGLYQFNSSASRTASGLGGKWIIQAAIPQSISLQIADKVKLLVDSTREDTRDRIRDMINEAMQETPRPSAREVSRRIARTWFGEPYQGEVGRGTAEEQARTARWETKTGENLFSYNRAYTIARTEIAATENRGIASALADIGHTTVEWMSYPDDGRSGPRKHYEMDGKVISIEAMQGDDPNQWFELPNGERAPYPQYYGLSAFNTVNCRCSIGPG